MKYILVSKNAILKDFNKVRLFKSTPKDEFSGWVIIAEKESRSFYKESLNQFQEIDINLVESYLPGFNDIKDIEGDKLFVHNEGLNRLVEINTEITRHISNGAFATNQSNVEVNFRQWYKHVKQPLRKHYLWILFSIILIPFTSFFSIIIFVFQVRKIRSYKEEIREYYKRGDTIPGIVTAINPTTIASMTDMTQGIGDYPVIKVFTRRAKKLGNRKIKIGDKIPLTTLYYTIEGSTLNYWHDIEPYPVEFATKDKNKIAEKKQSISILEWNRLSKILINYEYKTRPGLYKIDIEKSSWTNEENL